MNATDRQKNLEELSALLNDKALSFLAAALRGVIEGPDGYGSVEIIISDRQVSYVNFSTRMKINRVEK